MMKKVIYASLLAVVALITACSDDNQTSTKHGLGMIVMQANTNTRVLLMENGSLVYPISGVDINEFNNLRLGRKLLLDYTIIKTLDGVAQARVRELAISDTSSFNPDGPSEPETIFSTSFTGQFFITDADSTNVLNGEATFTFGAEEANASDVQYTINPEEGDDVEGATTFVVENGKLTFTDESGSILLPKKTYNYSVGFGWLYFWDVDDNGAFVCYSLMKDE